MADRGPWCSYTGIVIDNNPVKEYAGEDEQLNKAIEVILEEMKNYPGYVKPVPPYPVKNR
ncbi:MAG: hypothetical protein U5L72_08525 [Bacteroidales bacterium]|nr:hypothetical protein [Bacteroidales bacterium]